MKKNHIYYISNNKSDKIHACIWQPKNPKCILQIAHGMNEYIERYENIAKFFVQHDILVAGNDHLGHGYSSSKENLGFMGKDGHIHMIKDVAYLSKTLKQQFHLPLVILGHSMGSFIVRSYLQYYSDLVDVAFVMGTGYYSHLFISFLKMQLYILGKTNPPTTRLPMIQRLMNSMLSRNVFTNSVDWLSYNKTNIENFRKDILCHFCFTLDGYQNLVALIEDAHQEETFTKVRNNLPIRLMSGKNDPLLLHKNSLLNLLKKYQINGVKNIEMKLFEKMKHEILNEIEYDDVCREILNNIKENI